MKTRMETHGRKVDTFLAGCVFTALCACALTLHGEGAQPAKDSGGKPAKLPFVIFVERGSSSNHYAPAGWMGNAKSITADEGCTNNPHAGKTCLRYAYSGADDWGGVVWQDPANDWGELAGGWNLTGAKQLKFWARGEKGGETVSFKFGILGADKKFSDSSMGAINDVKLTKEWAEYTIDLSGKDLSRIKTGFVWSLAGQGSPVVFYLDDIRFE